MGLPTYLGLVIALAVGCQWLAWALRIPSLLLLLLTGFAVGQWQSADDVLGRDMVFAAATLAVGVILFEGSLTLRFRELRGIGGPVVRLCSAVPLIAWGLLTGAAYAVGIDGRLAALVGAILVVTGPTVINPILRQMRPTRRVSSLLRWEGIVVDPVGAILAVLVAQAIIAQGEGDTAAVIAASLARTLAVSLALSVPVGLLLAWVVRRHWVPDYLQGVLFLGVALGCQVASNAAASESGLLTVTVLGIVLANVPGLELRHVREFKEHLQVLLVGVLFIVLAGRVGLDQVRDVAPQALGLVALAVVLVRPVSVFLGLHGTAATRRERTLLAFMAPRGIVAASVTSIFALEFQHAADVLAQRAAGAADPGRAAELERQASSLASLGDDAQRLVPIVFILIVCTVAVYGLGVGRLAERLGLATTSPQGVLFAGAAPWVVQAAEQLDALDVPTVVVSDRAQDVSRARMKGLSAVKTNIVSEFAVEDLELAGIGTFIAATDVDSTNSIAAREFVHILGRSNAWQLRRDDDPEGGANHRTAPAPHLVGRYPFSPALTYARMTEMSDRGMVVRRTTLSDAFTFADFRREHPEAVVMFTHRGGRLTVLTEDSPEPGDGVLVALTGDRELGKRTVRNAERKAGKEAGAARRSAASDAPARPRT
ncbi:MAG: sodium:proton antiporter [Thermoleophilia bacterium]|nr:sodium:proton antiporter [Thermoleophilia bacterium]